LSFGACGFESHLRHTRVSYSARLGRLAHDWGSAPRWEYAYLLGMYLEDGCITRMPRSYRLRITLDAGYPAIIHECRGAVADRYFFSNRSEDIKTLFSWACELIGVETRRAGPKNISVARRGSVAKLNEFLGHKR
jgi:hypothetical protein